MSRHVVVTCDHCGLSVRLADLDDSWRRVYDQRRGRTRWDFCGEEHLDEHLAALGLKVQREPAVT